MKKYLLLAVLSIIIFLPEIKAQYRISGYIKDAQTGESLIGANIWQPSVRNGTATNKFGFYSVKLAYDTATLEVSYVGYESKKIYIQLDKDSTLNFELSLSDALSEVVVKGNRPSLELTKMSAMKIQATQIKSIPALLGEVDVMKAIQLMPGVQGGTEGSSGIYVRGGGPDQNLILLDGVPVYNASHLFGFFSVFNADAINTVDVIKGGFPARYGGRLSSVIDISMKEGNMQNWQAEGGIGLISSRLSVEGPLVKNKGSIIVSARRTYIDVLARPLIRAATEGEGDLGYYFYDLNAKANYILSDKDRIYISAYSGLDKFYAKDDYEYRNGGTMHSYDDEYGIKWGNITTAARWNHLFSNRLFLNTTATYSRYNFELFEDSESSTTNTDTGEFTDNSYYAAYNSGIQDYGLRLDFDYYLNNQHAIKFGVNYIYHIFQPEAFNVDGDFDSEFEMPNSPSIYGNEYAVYLEDEFEPIKKLKINAGIHASAFYVNKKWYPSFQPRISSRYLINDKLSVKASYAEMAQFLHLLTNSGIGLPTDLWVPVTENIKPQLSQQTAVGISSLIGKGNYEASIEGYYKDMKNLIEYREGSNFLEVSDSWENKVTTGDGWSYGSELLLRKNEGKLSGWVGYTLSWNYRQFEDLNFGRVYPYKYDRRHDISVVANYKVSEKFEIGGTWVYGTGNAITIPIARYPALNTSNNLNSNGNPDYDYYYQGDEVYQYSERNAYRMPSYHRADIGLTWHKKKKWGEASWNVSVYNLYNRQNPFFIDTQTNQNGETGFYQVSLFQLIPSVSYSFKIFPNDSK
jgi:outer membrane receptor for ferrienterochelin and colicin